MSLIASNSPEWFDSKGQTEPNKELGVENNYEINQRGPFNCGKNIFGA